MRKTTLVVFIAFTLSCSIQEYWIIPENIETFEDVISIVKDIDYKTSNYDDWQLPQTTYEKKSGDCEDFAGLFAHILIYKLNFTNVEIVVLKNNHTIVFADGKYYEPQNGLIITDGLDIKTSMNYDFYIYMAKLNKK